METKQKLAVYLTDTGHDTTESFSTIIPFHHRPLMDKHDQSALNESLSDFLESLAENSLIELTVNRKSHSLTLEREKKTEKETTNEIRFNINHSVLIKLNPFGLKAWEAYLKKFGLSPNCSAHMLPASHPLRNEYLKFQLWDVMAIFGGSLYNGCNLPFATEIILLPDSG